MTKKYLRVSEVAGTFGVSKQTVIRWCQSGDIESVYKGGSFYIPTDAIEPYQDGFKPKRVVMLEKENERLENEIRQLKGLMWSVAGTLLSKGELHEK